MALILVVDDDPTVREVLVSYLASAGLETVEAADGLTALEVAAERKPDLVLLDLSLPRLDGLEVFRRLRLSGAPVAVVMLTARGEEPDRVLGFEIGADDYVSKPFSPREVVLRVQSILRRATPVAAPTSTAALVTDADLKIDPAARRAWRADEEMSLTNREFDLLAHLMQNPGVAYSREDLMQTVWGWEFGDSSTVTVHVRRLREKIEPDPANPTRIATVWGVGYRWDPSGNQEA